MVDAHDPNGGDDELAPRHVLEALAVPELPYDFTDRVMGSLQAASVARVRASRPALPWVVAACSSAVALAATLLLVMMWKTSPPTPTPTPVAVVATTPTPTPAPTPLPVAGSPVPAAKVDLGHLVLTVEPADALVRVDGVVVAGPSPFVATNLPPGPHAIAIESEGHIPWTREIDLPVGELDLSIELAPQVTPSPSPSPKASVRPAPRPTGSPDLKNPFFPDPPPEDPFGDDAASGGSSPDMKDPFASAKTDKAVLRIGVNVGIAPAQIFVDGKLLGTSPIGSAKVKPGSHKVTWKWSDGREVTMSVVLAPGEVKLIKAG